MVRIFLKVSVLLLLVSALIISGCTTRYVCYDGSVERKEGDCPVIPYPTVEMRRAEIAVDTFAGAYAQALGSRQHRVNTFRVEGDWHSEVLFTNLNTGSVNRVTLKVDGRTSSVSCVEGCGFLDKAEGSVDINQSNVVEQGSGFTVY